MPLFDLDKHKLRVALEMAITAASGGAIAAITAAYTDPSHFNLSLEGLKDLARVAGAGAFTGILFLLRSMPRNPATFERRADLPQVATAAVKLGIIQPEVAAAAKAEYSAELKSVAADAASKIEHP